jgi:signal transduction histidine kinase
MRPRTLKAWRSDTRLLRQFATLSLLVISLITLALSLTISYYLRKDLLEREWRITADWVRAETLYHLTPEDFAAPTTGQAQGHFRRYYQETIMMPEIVRVKIYDPAMTVIWSDDPRLIGLRFPDNPALATALTGRIDVKLDIEKKGENLYEQDEGGGLVEVYVPIVFPGRTGLAGVVETYKRPEQVFFNIRRSQVVVVGTALAGGIVLYLSLFWIVLRATRRIETQRALTARLHGAREEERVRVSQEIHDELGQALTCLKMDLSWLASRLPEDPPTLREKAREMVGLADTTINATRRIFTDLRPPVLDHLGLVVALEWQAEDFQARTGIQCQCASGEARLAVEPDLAVALFRVCQEALTNVARHAGATRVTIRLERQAADLVLSIEDDGRGVTDREIADPRSLGLLGMRERVSVFGGALRVTGTPGKGTVVTLTVPFESGTPSATAHT